MIFFYINLLIILFSYQLDAKSKLINYNPIYHEMFLLNNSKDKTNLMMKKNNNNQIASLIVPGYGQWKLNRKKRAVFFSTLELLFLSSWAYHKRKADSLDEDLKKFADENWNLYRWWINTPQLTSSYGDVICEGTHHLNIFVGGDNTTISSNDLCSNGWIEGLEVVKDHEFYENIGKYDQFIAGWSDLFNSDGSQNWWNKDKLVGTSSEVIVMTEKKSRYIDQRKKSNSAYSFASYMITGLMFNHFISAVDFFLISRINNKNNLNFSSNIKINSLIYDDYKGFSLRLRW